MHPRQASLLESLQEITEKTAAKKPVALGGTPMLYKYVDQDGEEFFLPKKLRSVHSPYTGKNFPAKPEKHTPMDVGKELREESKAPPPAASGAPGPKSGLKKKRANEDWKA